MREGRGRATHERASPASSHRGTVRWPSVPCVTLHRGVRPTHLRWHSRGRRSIGRAPYRTCDAGGALPEVTPHDQVAPLEPGAVNSGGSVAGQLFKEYRFPPKTAMYVPFFPLIGEVAFASQ